ncbi:MAG: mannan endo,4-beta-mannosidase [Daejeonella sp.]|nr:mannan endo,4-beta-mannosidase [Daejeonella sp.]
MVDKQATDETAALYYNLQKLSKKHILFGHQDATAYGHNWSQGVNRSDVKDVTGSHPAVIGLDFSGLAFAKGERLANEKARLSKLIIDTYKRGGVVTMAWHLRNPATEGSFYWEKDPVRGVEQIIPGGVKHEVYKKLLQDIADLTKSLKGKDGKQIPLIFRPFHEFDGDWFWWGKSHCTIQQFTDLWKFTVNYLRDDLKVHSFIYAFSPDCTFNTKEQFWERYPGNDFVDMLGTDNYADMGRDGANYDVAAKKLKIVADVAKSNKKLAAFTETGLESITDSTWFTEKLLPVLRKEKLNLAYVLVWRNASDNPKHFYAPFKGHPAETDFIKFYKEDYILFENELPNLYKIK